MTHILYKVVFALHVNEQLTSIEVIFAITHLRTGSGCCKGLPAHSTFSGLQRFGICHFVYLRVVARFKVAIGVCKLAFSNTVVRGTSRLSHSPQVQDGSNSHDQNICSADVVKYNRDAAFR
jgi:hypothetical protein